MRLLFNLSVVLLLFQSSLRANVRLPALIADRMVLQREVKLPVWGWADPGEKITIQLAHKIYRTTTAANGKWYLKLDAFKAGGPYQMTIRGKNTINVKDVLIGDVFICSGQSNMEKGIDRSLYQNDIQNSKNNLIRQFRIDRSASDTVLNDVLSTARWQAASPETLGNYSAVAYFFAKDLFDKYKIPIGIINTSYGSSLAEAWISRDGLKDFPAFYTQARAKISQSNPMMLYNAMLAPLINYGIKGVLWYQGEFNASRAYQYRKLLTALVKDWRKQFKQNDLPFIVIQLPNYNAPVDSPGESAIAELREAQAMILKLPKTALVVTIDINSTTDIHPKEKKPIGIRSSLAAQKLIYGEQIVASGPRYLSSTINGNKMTIRFTETGGGLKITTGGLRQFIIAGADRKFVHAIAVIKGNTVEVYQPGLSVPIAVRYAWADNPKEVNLYNTEGFPAAPFRTDDWPGITQIKSTIK